MPQWQVRVAVCRSFGWWVAGRATGVVYARGVLLTPEVGAVLLSASTVVVAVNAQLLKRAHL